MISMKATYFISKKLKSRLAIVAENKKVTKGGLVKEYFDEYLRIDKKDMQKLMGPNYKTPPKRGVKGKNKNKIKSTYTLDDSLVSDIELIAKFKGKSKDELVEEYLTRGIKKDEKYLTSHLTTKEIEKLSKRY